MSVSYNILKVYYATVLDLHTCLTRILHPARVDGQAQSSHDSLIQKGDHATYIELINRSYVAFGQEEADKLDKHCFKACSPMVDMREIIDKAQERIFGKCNGRPSNIITAGYRLASGYGDSGRINGQRPGITNYFVNTMVTALQSSEWERLLQRVGEDVMFYLLTSTSIFIPLPNQCLCQITGDPLIHMRRQELSCSKESVLQHYNLSRKRHASAVHPDERPRKRSKLVASSSLESIASNAPADAKRGRQRRSPIDIIFPRMRLFYARPKHVPKTSAILVGLPPKHILNRLIPAFVPKSPATPDIDKYDDAENARHLAKYVFPRQYGLSSIFELDRRSGTSYHWPDFSDREEEIKSWGPCKTPKRVKSILPDLDKLAWKHGKCKYRLLRDKVCPSKVHVCGRDSTPLDSSIILELMSDSKSHVISQASRNSNALSDPSGGVFTAGDPAYTQGQHEKVKPRFAEFACDHIEVYRYAILITKVVIPQCFWGCEGNFKVISEYVKSFITCRRYESLSLHQVLQRFRISECDWHAPHNAKYQREASVTDSLKRRELLEDFLYWYFDGFLLPLLRTTFYVTESSAFRNRVLYFRHDDWCTLCEPLIDRLAEQTFQKLEQEAAQEAMRQRRLGFSFIRLLPKETGVRPIVNLRRKKQPAKGSRNVPEQSINQILQATFEILTYEKKAQSSRLGASVFGANDVYARLKEFKRRVASRRPSNNVPKLYFVKLDVQTCFDTIEQSRLLDILRTIISEDAYMIQRYGRVSQTKGKTQKTYVKKAFPEDDHPHFLEHARQLASALRSTILVDQVVYPYVKREEIMELLEEHITDNIVKIGSDYYRQMVGIPQGSVLSTLLCSFFYGDLEKRDGKFGADYESMLLRLVDDYLFVTTSLASAKSFLDMMMKGHPDYGCFISKEKTMTNFHCDLEFINVVQPHEQSFPWCGYMINMKNLSVSVDYSRYHDSYLSDSITVENGRHCGAAFTHKMFQLFKRNSHVVYYDLDLNTDYAVFLNIYQNFLVVAMKMLRYVESGVTAMTQRARFIHNTIKQILRYAYKIIRRKTSNGVATENNARCNISEAAVVWLGTHAFHNVVSRKPTQYRGIIRSLGFDLSLAKYRRMHRRFCGVVSEGSRTITQLSF